MRPLRSLHVRRICRCGRAIGAYVKCGFAIEGREREAALVDGTWYDDVMMGILDREWFSRKNTGLENRSPSTET